MGQREKYTLSPRFPGTVLSPRHSSHVSKLTPKSDLSRIKFKQMLTCSLVVCILECFRSFKINFGSKQTWTSLYPKVLSTEFYTHIKFAAVSKLKQLEGCTSSKNCEHIYD